MRLLPIWLLALIGIGVVSAQTDQSRETLFAAIRSGSTAEVERQLKAGVAPDVIDTDGTPAVMAAALFGDADMVKALLDRGADVNRSGPAGTTRSGFWPALDAQLSAWKDRRSRDRVAPDGIQGRGDAAICRRAHL